MNISQLHNDERKSLQGLHVLYDSISMTLWKIKSIETKVRAKPRRVGLTEGV